MNARLTTYATLGALTDVEATTGKLTAYASVGAPSVAPDGIAALLTSYATDGWLTTVVEMTGNVSVTGPGETVPA
jgi:hypothetical protein